MARAFRLQLLVAWPAGSTEPRMEIHPKGGGGRRSGSALPRRPTHPAQIWTATFRPDGLHGSLFGLVPYAAGNLLSWEQWLVSPRALRNKGDLMGASQLERS